VEEGQFVSDGPTETLEQQLELPNQNGALHAEVEISLIEELAAQLGIDPEYISLSGSSDNGAAVPTQRHMQRALTTGLSLKITILSSGSGALPSALVALTSNQSFWQAVNNRVAASGTSSTLDASGIVVHISILQSRHVTPTSIITM
jgi:hypothetical protein